METLRVIKFWCVAFIYILWRTLKGDHWNMVYVDFDYGMDDNGRQKRKQLIAKRTVRGFELRWQDFGAWVNKEGLR